MMQAARPGSRIVTYGIVVLGLLGAIVLVEGSLVGERQHRLFAAVAGSTMLFPSVGLLIWRNRFHRVLKRVAFSLIPLVVLLGAMEVVLRVIRVETLARPEVRTSAVLEFEMVPNTGDMDDWGFRNPSVPERADVVVLGDSMTYGFGVYMSECYPALLARASSLPVYNMGVGGYGPVQYLALAERAFELKPRILVVGFYLGNDLSDAHRAARLPRWKELQNPDIEYPQFDEGDTLEPKNRNLASKALLLCERHSRVIGFTTGRLRVLLRKNTYLSGVYAKESGAPKCGEVGIETLFTPKHRIRAMNLADETTRDGMRISAKCFESLARLADQNTCRVFVVALHTKEYYYYHFLRRNGRGAEKTLETLAQLEARITEHVSREARALGLFVVDPLEDMVEALENGSGVFPINADGHPTKQGHAVIAHAIWKRIKG